MRFKVIKENKDGSAKCEVSLNKKELKMIAELAIRRKRRFSAKFIREVILEAINNQIEKEKHEIS